MLPIGTSHWGGSSREATRITCLTGRDPVPFKSSSLEKKNHDSKIPMSETDISEISQIMSLEKMQQICAPL